MKIHNEIEKMLIAYTGLNDESRIFYVSIIITKQSKHISKIGRVISKVVIRILGEGRDE